MLKHFFKKNTKKQANQTAFAGIEKKKSFKSGRNATVCCILSNYLKAWQSNINHII